MLSRPTVLESPSGVWIWASWAVEGVDVVVVGGGETLCLGARGRDAAAAALISRSRRDCREKVECCEDESLRDDEDVDLRISSARYDTFWGCCWGEHASALSTLALETARGEVEGEVENAGKTTVSLATGPVKERKLGSNFDPCSKHED